MEIRVAAELIGTPLNSLGEQLYLSKITIDTAAVFAWTLVIIILGSIFGGGSGGCLPTAPTAETIACPTGWQTS